MTAYLQLFTHSHTLLHLLVFPDETLAADLRHVCLILDPADLFAFGGTLGPSIVSAALLQNAKLP